MTTKLLIGHKRASLTYGHYSKGARVKLRKAIEKLKYAPEVMPLIRGERAARGLRNRGVREQRGAWRRRGPSHAPYAGALSEDRALLAHSSRGEYLSARCVFPLEPSLSVGFPRPRPGKLPLENRHTLGRGSRWQTSLTTSGDAAVIACVRVYARVTFLRTKIYQGR